MAEIKHYDQSFKSSEHLYQFKSLQRDDFIYNEDNDRTATSYESVFLQTITSYEQGRLTGVGGWGYIYPPNF